MIRVRKSWIKYIILAIVLTTIWVGACFIEKWYNTDPGAKFIVRDLVVAAYAHVKAGDRVPVDVEYWRNDPTRIISDWRIVTNARWFSDYARLIVPHMEYEGITDWGKYPTYVIVQPMNGRDSYHMLGMASKDGVVRLNERMIIGNRSDGPDARVLLATLVHELVHLQGGDFRGKQGYITEGKTQAATLEILAAMCNYRDELACKAFWNELEDYARGSLRRRFRIAKQEYIYDWISDLLWRDAEDQRASRKSSRYWDESPENRNFLGDILYDYLAYPWEKFVIKGLAYKDMNTGIYPASATGFINMPFKMPFNDSRDMLGWVANFLVRMSPDE